MSRSLRRRPVISQFVALSLIASGFVMFDQRSEASATPANPSITSVSPTHVPLEGGTIVVSGDEFSLDGTETVVRLDDTVLGVADSLSVSRTVVTFAAPATATVGTRVIGITVGSSVEVTATIQVTRYNPVVSVVSPGSGRVAGGETITVRGSGFAPSAGVPVSVTIGRFQATNVTVVSDTELTLSSPVRSQNDRTVGALPLVVTVGDGADESPSTQLQYFSFAPQLEAIKSGRVTLGDLASRSKQKTITRGNSGPPYLVSGTDSRTNQPYSYFTDRLYSGRNAYARESDERGGTLSTTQTTFGETETYLARSSIRLQSSATCNSPNNVNGLETYCSMFGPEVYSEPFYGRAGQALSFDWAAQKVSDDYEIYAFLVAVPDLTGISSARPNSDHTLVLHSLGSSRGWTTSSGIVPADGLYRFRFVNGSYDATGGYALGSRMYLSPSAIVGEPNAVSFTYSGGSVERFTEVTVTASASSGAAVSLIPENTAICQVISSTHSGSVTSFRVRGVGVGNCVLNASQGAVGVFSPAPTVQQSFQILAAPIAETVTPTAGPLNIRVQWSAVASVSGYFLEYSTDGSTWTRHNSTSTTSRDVTVPNLTPANEYQFRVIAVLSGTERTPSIATSALRPLVPPPTNVEGESVPGGISVTWTAAASAEGYTVEYSSDSGSTWTVANQSQVASPPFQLTGLNTSSEYVLRVKAHIGPASSTYANSTGPGITPEPDNGSVGGLLVSPDPSPAPSVTPSPTPNATPTPRPRPRATATPRPLPVVPSPIPTVPTEAPTPVPNPTPRSIPVVIPEREPTPGVVFTPTNPIPQTLVEALLSPLAYRGPQASSPALPTLAPTESIAFENGAPVDVALVLTSNQNGYLLQGDNWQVTLEATDTQGNPLVLDDTGNIVLNSDRFVQFQGSGFAPGSIIKVWLFSDPASIANVLADKNGNFTGGAQLPESIPTGQHTVQLNGLSTDGQVRSVALGVVVQPDVIPAPTITPVDFTPLWNLALITAGVVMMFILVIVARRRWLLLAAKRRKRSESEEPILVDDFDPFLAQQIAEATPLQQFPVDSRRKKARGAPPRNSPASLFRRNRPV